MSNDVTIKFGNYIIEPFDSLDSTDEEKEVLTSLQDGDIYGYVIFFPDKKKKIIALHSKEESTNQLITYFKELNFNDNAINNLKLKLNEVI